MSAVRGPLSLAVVGPIGPFVSELQGRRSDPQIAQITQEKKKGSGVNGMKRSRKCFYEKGLQYF